MEAKRPPSVPPDATTPALAVQRPVFVVDDDPAILSALKFNLEIEGFTVETYPDAGAMLAGIAGRRWGCLVIDYNLPGDDGLTMLEAMRLRGMRLPAILITTAPTTAVRQRAAAADAIVVEKPLFGNALIEAVQRAFPA